MISLRAAFTLLVLLLSSAVRSLEPADKQNLNVP
jgi:hypothetical protein